MASKKNTSINGQEYFRIKRTIGHTMVDGKRKPITKQFYGTSKGDAERKYKEYLEAQSRAKYEKQERDDLATLHDRAKDYMENVLTVTSKYAEGTKDLYKRSYNKHINGSWLDSMCVKDIKASTLQRFYNSLDITHDALQAVHKFLAALYKWMVINDYADNVLPAVELPKKQKVVHKADIQVWEDSELDAVLRLSEGYRNRFLLYLLNYTGLRISEALDLKYSDIRDNVINVNTQLYEGDHIPPKYNSKRDIPLHQKLITELELHKEWHEAEMVKNGYDTEYIFTTETGNQYDRRNVSRSFARYLKRIGIEQKGFHVFRATFCTNLCRAGVSLEVASKLLGHKSLEITAAHYALVKPDTKVDAIALLA